MTDNPAPRTRRALNHILNPKRPTTPNDTSTSCPRCHDLQTLAHALTDDYEELTNIAAHLLAQRDRARNTSAALEQELAHP